MNRKAVVFDLGAVMVEWAPEAISASFTASPELQAAIMREVYQHDDWLELDRGTLTEMTMIKRVSQRLALPATTVTALFQHTKNALHPIEETYSAFRKAKARGLGVYCLSNICEPFFDHLAERNSFFAEFDGAIVSAKEKTIKPESLIFERLLERYQLNPVHTLFIDDRADNIATANQLGFHTLHFKRSPECYRVIDQFIGA